MNTTNLLWSFLIGTIGFGYFIYGKNTTRFIFLLSGIAMCAYPYFVQNILFSIIIGIILLIIPFVIK